MAVHPSVIKRHRQSLRRRIRNQQVKSRIRTIMKRIKQSVEGKDRQSASTQLKEFNKALGKAVNKGILKSNTASRWLSRLSRSVSRLAT